MTDQQKQIIEDNLSSDSKASLIALSAVYDELNGTNISNDCWCSRRGRQTTLKMISEWYNNQKTSDE